MDFLSKSPCLMEPETKVYLFYKTDKEGTLTIFITDPVDLNYENSTWQRIITGCILFAKALQMPQKRT